MSYANSADANQTPRSAATTLSLHCFHVCLPFYRTLDINGLEDGLTTVFSKYRCYIFDSSYIVTYVT